MSSPEREGAEANPFDDVRTIANMISAYIDTTSGEQEEAADFLARRYDAAYRRGLERAAGACGECGGVGSTVTNVRYLGKTQVPCLACAPIRALLKEGT